MSEKVNAEQISAMCEEEGRVYCARLMYSFLCFAHSEKKKGKACAVKEVSDHYRELFRSDEAEDLFTDSFKGVMEGEARAEVAEETVGNLIQEAKNGDRSEVFAFIAGWLMCGHTLARFQAESVHSLSDIDKDEMKSKSGIFVGLDGEVVIKGDESHE